MEKEFVPYEIALELKDLGFDEPCLKYQWNDKKYSQFMCMSSNQTKVFCLQKEYQENEKIYTISIPTFSQAFDFILFKYQGFEIRYFITDEKEYWHSIFKGGNFHSATYSKDKCLKKLIEIIKSE